MTITHRPIFQQSLDFSEDKILFIVKTIVQLVITSFTIMASAIGNSLFDKLIESLNVQILAKITKQESKESKRRQKQGIKISKANGVYKGRSKLYYADDTKAPQCPLAYKNIAQDIENGVDI